MRWMSVPTDPRFWAVMFKAMNPATWAKWMGAPLNPRNYSPLFKAANPATPVAWTQILADPKNYPVWNSLSVPFGNTQSDHALPAFPNFFDPRTWSPPAAASAPAIPDSGEPPSGEPPK
jgi:hypothetical protein